jgi:5-methyltetrahydrofolate--homocysteine methyltransferase
MTFDATPKGFRTVIGTTIEQAASGLGEAGANIVGSNCGNGIVNMVKIAEEFRRDNLLPIIIQSNAGISALADDVLRYPESPEFMAEKSLELRNIGAKIIGGCCGTTPEHIRLIKKAVLAS